MSQGLVEQAMHGSHDAFTVLADRALARLLGTASLILHDRGYAEDATQDALVRAWRDLPTLRDPDRFDAWLHRLLVHACQDQLRRRRHELAEVPVVADQTPPIPDQYAGLADRDELARGLQQLTAKQRTVVVLHYYLGLSHPEIAEATGLPLGTVKSRLNRSLAYLQAALAADARSGPSGTEPA